MLKDIDCQFAVMPQTEQYDYVDPKTGEKFTQTAVTRCDRVSEYVKFTASVGQSICAKCDGRLPIGSTEKPKPIEECPYLMQVVKNTLAATLTDNTAVLSNVIDPVEKFGAYVAVAGKAKARELLGQMFRWQVVIPAADSPETPEQLQVKFNAIGTAYGMMDTVEAIRAAYDANLG